MFNYYYIMITNNYYLKTLLIAPHQYLDAKNDFIRLKQPLGLALLKSNTPSEVVLFDALAEGYKIREIDDGVLRVGTPMGDLLDMVRKENPDIVGVSNLWSSNYPAAAEILRAVKKEIPSVHTMMGGVHPSFEYKNLLKKDFVDFVAVREATESLPKLLAYLQGDLSWDEVTGIARRVNGIVQDPRPAKNVDLKSLNPIDYRDFPVELYGQQAKFGLGGVINADFVSSLGCPHSCDYCSTKQMWPGKLRTYSEEQLDFMLDSIVEAGYDFVSVQDDNLAANPRNAKLLMKKLKERQLPWHWEGGAEIGFLQYVLEDLINSSCVMVDVAIETAVKSNDGIYDKFRPDTEERLFKGLSEMKNAGIFVNSNFMLGIPGETKEDIQRTVEYAFELKRMGLIDHANFHLAMAYPGTVLGLQEYERPQGEAPRDYFGYSAVIGNVPHKDYDRRELIDLRNQADAYVNGKELFELKRRQLNRY